MAHAPKTSKVMPRYGVLPVPASFPSYQKSSGMARVSAFSDKTRWVYYLHLGFHGCVMPSRGLVAQHDWLILGHPDLYQKAAVMNDDPDFGLVGLHCPQRRRFCPVCSPSHCDSELYLSLIGLEWSTQIWARPIHTARAGGTGDIAASFDAVKRWRSGVRRLRNTTLKWRKLVVPDVNSDPVVSLGYHRRATHMSRKLCWRVGSMIILSR